MDVTKVNEYRSKNQKIITLSSGAVFRIRKLSAIYFISTSNIPIPIVGEEREELKEMDEQKRGKNLKDNIELSHLILCQGVVEPKISIKIDDENTLHISELTDDDMGEILEEITKFSGMGKEAAKALKPFPEKQISTTTGSDGTEIQYITAPAPDIAS